MNFGQTMQVAVLAPMMTLLGACGTAVQAPSTPPDTFTGEVWRVTGGLVGASADSTASVRIVKGIPFAAPPVGDLRWKEPQPVIPWAGVVRPNDFAASCHQGNRPAGRPGSILYQPAPLLAKTACT